MFIQPSVCQSASTFMSDLQRVKAAGCQLPQSFQLDGQAMAVPAWDVVDLSPPQHLKTITNVFQDLEQKQDNTLIIWTVFELSLLAESRSSKSYWQQSNNNSVHSCYNKP